MSKTIEINTSLYDWCIKHNKKQLLDERDYEDNKNDITCPDSPKDISRGNSRIKIHWKCSVCGYKRTTTCNKRTTLDKRTGHPTNCPHCSRSGTSVPEQIILYYVTKYFSDVVHRDKSAIGKELDIYIPSIKTAIEFDGDLYHKNKLEGDNLKDKLCFEKGIFLIRVRDRKLKPTESALIIPCSVNETLYDFDKIVRELLLKLGVQNNLNIDIDRDYSDIVSSFRKKTKDESLLIKYPQIAKEWDYDKNKGLRPENFSSGERYLAWWRCSQCGTLWQAPIYSRTKGNHGCPKCGLEKQGKSYAEGRAKLCSLENYCIENNLKNILEEWDYTANFNDKNCPNTPDQISYAASREVHWVCKTCGFKWSASPSSRIAHKYPCPKCTNKLVIKGFNDLETYCRRENKINILEERDFDENKKDDDCPNFPNEIQYNSSKKVHWICKTCGFKWSARVDGRTMSGKGCRVCAKSIRAKKNKKRIINLDTGVIYDSVKEAGIAIRGKPVTSIIDCLKGRTDKALGYRRKYLDDSK